MAINESHYCSCLTKGEVSEEAKALLRGHKAALLLGAKWPLGDTISIRFLGGDPQLQQRVRKATEEWTKLANLTFDFRTSGPTDVRIAFIQGNGSWSYLGTMCQRIVEPEPTMNFGWLTPDSEPDDVRRVVLHEFGHMLGLVHEHQNPKGGGIDWNRDAVIADLSGPPNNWDSDTIERNMFHKYDPKKLAMTDVDEESIMMYPIPRAWTRDGTSAGLNKQLSGKDKAFIETVYPR